MTLSRDELWALDINEEIAKEALDQASAMLSDALDTKKNLEQRAAQLLGTYIAIALAASATIGVLKNGDQPLYVVPVAIGVCTILIGAGMFIVAMLPAKYGVMGSSPESWLQAGIINGRSEVLGRMIAVSVADHIEKIDQSYRATGRKTTWLARGMWCGPASVALTGFAFALVSWRPWLWWWP